jgi:fimbrial chaperone protein
MRLFAFATALFAGLHSISPSEAASLRVSPVLIDLSAPTATSSLRIWNDAQRPINVQVRIFRWSQKDGQEIYTPAEGVVASPPITKLKPGGENMIRVVRTTKQPVQAEESYRLIVDELPDPNRRQGGTVVMVVRHSIPVFFTKPVAGDAAVAWSVQQKPGGYQVTATNDGARRFKISNLSLLGSGGAVAQQDGLVGYALGKSTMSWFVPATRGTRTSGRSLTIRAENEAGPFNATASVKGG